MYFLGQKYPESIAMYDKTNRLSEKCGKILLFVTLKLTFNCLILARCIGSFITYFTMDMGGDSFVLPVPMWWERDKTERFIKFFYKKKYWRKEIVFFFSNEIWRFPFDTKNPIGYLVACSLQYIHLAYEAFFIVNTASLGLGSYFFAMTAIEDVKSILRSINAQCTENISTKGQLQALNQVHEFIRMHSTLKQLSSYFLYGDDQLRKSTNWFIYL